MKLFFLPLTFLKVVKQNACGAFQILVGKFRAHRRPYMGQKALFLYVNLSLHRLFTALKLKSRQKYAIALV